MIKSLHRRLALLLILAISLALLCAAGAALWVSERQLTLREQAAFIARLDLLAQDVRMERSVSSAQLAKTEAADRLVLTIYDNGQPISFRGGWQPATPRKALFERVIQAADLAGVTIDGGANARFVGSLRGDLGERYLAAVQIIGGYRSQRGLVMLKDMRTQDSQRASLRLLFAGITLCAVAVMCVFGWLFTGRAVRPIAQAYAEQNAFVAAASHELRTPLQIMQSSLDALRGNPDDPSGFISAMQRELNRMSRLSEELTTLSNMGGETRSAFGPVELTELVDEAVRDHQASAGEKRIDLRLIEPEIPLPLIEGDPLMLRRAVNVLIDNAVCYTQPGGHVEISIKTQQRELQLCVKDDGPGIAPEHLPHIFQRFYRADRNRSDRTHRGLGLCIAKEMVERHGGKLWFEGLRPTGSRFIIRLPRIPSRFSEKRRLLRAD